MIRKLCFSKIRLFLLMIVVIMLTVGVFELLSIMLIRTQNLTGWILFFLVLFLVAYKLRKKVSFLPIGSVSQWLFIHITAGLLSAVLFFIHAGFAIPNGLFEIILYLLYMTVFMSGLAGYFLSRTIPSRLNMHGEEVIYERIPLHLSKVRQQVESVVFEAVDKEKTSVISDFYLKYLREYFLYPTNRVAHLFHSERHKRSMFHRIHELERFLSESEKEITKKISELILVKENIDYQYSLQSVLKLWLFIHVPLTYSLILLAFFHALVASAFSSLI